MKRIKDNLSRIFLVLFVAFFVVIIFGTIFDNKNLVYVEKPAVMILMFVVMAVLLVVVYRFGMKKINEKISVKNETVITVVLMGVLLILQGFYAYLMMQYPSWDWNDVMNAARNHVLGNPEATDWAYFANYPNNNWMLYVDVLIFKILNFFGWFGSVKIEIVFSVMVNIILIDLSVVLLYFAARNLIGKKNAIFALIVCIMSYAFYGYIPTFYTDTATMMFPILVVLLYGVFLKTHKVKYLIWGGVASVIGFELKATVAIVLIAVAIDMLLRFKLKEIWKGFLALAVACVVTLGVLTGIETKFSVVPEEIRNSDQRFPWTHWVMMGMTERETQMGNGRKWVGWFNGESLKYTLSFENTEAMKEANLRKIQEQYEDWGFFGYLGFLYRKLLFTWSDSTFYAPYLVNFVSVFHEDDPVLGKLSSSEGYRKVVTDWNTGVMLCLYVGMIAGAIGNLVKRENRLRYGFLAIFGLLAFLLIWEDSSRYLITFYPVMVLLAVYGFSVIMGNRGYLGIIDEKRT